MAPNPKTVAEHADLVEHLYETGGPPLSVEAGTTGQQRVWLLEHHQAIQDELRRRGWSDVQATIDREPGIERFLIRIAPDDDA